VHRYYQEFIVIEGVELKTFRIKIKTNLKYIYFVPHRGEHSWWDENDTFETVLWTNLTQNLLCIHWYLELAVVEVIKRSLSFSLWCKFQIIYVLQVFYRLLSINFKKISSPKKYLQFLSIGFMFMSRIYLPL
jgi:hypothetical protein